MQTCNIKLSKFCKKNKIDTIDNKNLDDSCLNNEQFDLNRKRNSYFLNYLDCVDRKKFLPVSNSSDVSLIKGLSRLRKQYSPKYNYHLNINSIQNKVNHQKNLISDSVDVLCIAESKLNGSFLNSEIVLEGFNKKPYRLNVTASSGGLLTRHSKFAIKNHQ